tara:strand:+ start:4555 stop:4971 length:417 start_codon:yes stop_codon:yes gene_type:complete
MAEIKVRQALYDRIKNKATKNKSKSSMLDLLDEDFIMTGNSKRYKVNLDENDVLYIKIKKVRHNLVREPEPEPEPEKPTHPCAQIIKYWFKDHNPKISKFCFLGYFGFTPLIKCGTNGRQIHNDYEDYWSKFEYYFKD